MSLQNCAISGAPLQDPVVSKKTGHIFERSLIEKHIASTGECPITHQPLSNSDLIAIQTTTPIKPRPLNTTGVPQLITILQNEWDALMLETFSLKQHLETVRQELSHALYQHDAACRVIARLIKERDEARALLGNIREGKIREEEVEESVLGKVVKEINEKAVQLNSLRKERKKKGEEWIGRFPAPESLQHWEVKSKVSLHSASKPGINALDINPNNNDLFVTGGNDHHVLVYDQEKSQIITSFTKHNKKINEVTFINDPQSLLVATASDDHVGYVFSLGESGEQDVKYSINCHKGAIYGIANHPINYLQAYGSKDKTWSFHDIAKGKMVFRNEDFLNSELNFNTIKIHPDGHILGLGASDGTTKLYNIVENSLVETLSSHNAELSSIAFSENGFYFATGSQVEGVVNVWDLRKLGLVKSVLTTEDQEKFKFKSLEFDWSGQYLAIGGAEGVRLYNTKTWDEITRFQAHSDVVTSLKFGIDSKFMVSASLDRHLIVYSG